MGFSLSPSVTVTETDLTLYVPNVATSIGALVGFFQWGPVEEITTLSSEKNLVEKFGQPDDSNYRDWYSAFNFLAYSNNLKTIRVVDDAVALNASLGSLLKYVSTETLDFVLSGSTITSTVDDLSVFSDGDIIEISGTTLNDGTYTVTGAPTSTVITVTEALADETAPIGTKVVTDKPASYNFSLTSVATVAFDASTITTTTDDVSVFNDGESITVSGSASNDGVYTIVGTPSATVITIVETLTTEATSPIGTILSTTRVNALDSNSMLIKNSIDRDAKEATIVASDVDVFAKYAGEFGNRLKVSIADASSYGAMTWPNGIGSSAWDYKNFFNIAPDGDEIYVVVLLDGNVVENIIASKDPASIDAVTGGSAYVKEVVNRTSKYIWMVAENLYSGTVGSFTNVQFEGDLIGGVDGYADSASSDDERQPAWDLMNDTELLDINFCITADASPVTGKYVIDNIAGYRKDCVAYVSPKATDVVGAISPVTDIDVTRQLFGSSSYAFMDGNYKYQYDKYNDTYRWVPFNGDMAGVAAYTDFVEDPWWSPAGLNRGQIKNVIKLALNPTKTQRDDLYRVAVNPIVIFRGEGAVLFGDKTLQTKPSAFDRINVRRLFIVLEKAISTAAKYMLFEFNDSTTRNQFLTLVEPYLRNVKARRGVYEYKVVCDETNNTPDVIDRNEFIGDIYIKPTRSINFIYLNFVAVASSVTFEEVLLNQG